MKAPNSRGIAEGNPASPLFPHTFGDDPANRARPRDKIIQKIWKSFFKTITDQVGINRFYFLRLIMKSLEAKPLISPESEDDVVSSHRIPVVKLHSFTQLKLVDLGIGTDGP